MFSCPICGANPIPARWTDRNGEINCMDCGIPLQIINGTDAMKEDGDYPYTQMYDSLAVHFKEYWGITHKRARFGSWMGWIPDGVEDEQLAFWKWLEETHPEWEAPLSSTGSTNNE